MEHPTSASGHGPRRAPAGAVVPDGERLPPNEALVRLAGYVAGLGGWSVDLVGRKIEWSDEVCAIHEVPPGTSPSLEQAIDFYAPEWREAVGSAFDACAREGSPFDLEMEVIGAKGRRSWVRAIGVPGRDKSGAIVRVQGAFQEINERKLAELELGRSNRALLMLSRCNEALIRTAEEISLVRTVCEIAVSLGGYSMAWVGYPRQDEARSVVPVAQAGDRCGYLERVSFSWSEDAAVGRGPVGRSIRSAKAVVVWDAETDEMFKPWLATFLACGFKSIVSLPLRDKDKAFGVLVLYSAAASRIGHDETALLQRLADDLAFGITSARARVEIAKSERNVREHAALLDEARDAILVRDLGNRITFWNKAAERLYGWSAREAAGQSVEKLLNLDAAAFAQSTRDVLTKGEWMGELHKKSRDGTNIIVECRWTLVRDEAGIPQSILAIDTDVTERKLIEAQFLRSQRVESIGNLAGGIAHDLNNVLAPILMGVGLLKAGIRDEREGRILNSIEISAQRGADMVGQVLAFARGVEGDHIPINPRKLIGEIANVVRETFPKSIEVNTEVPKDVWSIVADPTQLHQVLLNLCVNARDAMPGGGMVTIRAQNVEIDEQFASMNREGSVGPHVLISVTDTGTGIHPDIKGKIFDPFFTTKEVGRGTGLGLSSVATIVRGHNGFVLLDSELGGGTTFRLYFPAAQSPKPASAAPFAPKPPRGRGEWVLVVDDEASVRLITQHTLEMFGYRVLTAGNGVEGVSLYAERRGDIALVITDMMMPIMEGSAMIQALMTMNPDVRIIATSGLGTNGSVTRSAGPGVKHFLPKPYSAQTMLYAVHRALNE
ncbi:MAG TPA: PAS domain S-box protein [Opitutaceae bacterium]|nr:PAS domain S-box protein [Opitutaceae bacterium]